jgi:hypothetical protein
MRTRLQRTLLPSPGGLVPREDVYLRYKEFCAANGLESTTGSGFGRIVARVFPLVRNMRALRARSLSLTQAPN